MGITCCGACNSDYLLFKGESRTRFEEARWQRRGSLLGQASFLVFRALVATYWIGWVIAQAIKTSVKDQPPNRLRYFIYYTHWSALLIAAYFAVALIICIGATFHLVNTRPSERYSIYDPRYSQFPALYRLMWFLHATSGTAQLVTVVIYWALVYKGTSIEIFNVHVHGVGLLLWLLNTVVSDTPMSVLQVIYPFLYTGVYLTFTVIYHFLHGVDRFGNKYIYEALDYNKDPKKAGVYIVAVMLVLLPIGHIALATLSFALEKVAQAMGGKSHSYDPKHNRNGKASPQFLENTIFRVEV